MLIKIKVALMAQKRTQVELAREVKISEARLSRIIHAHEEPSPAEKRRIAAALGLDVAEAFTGGAS